MSATRAQYCAARSHREREREERARELVVHATTHGPSPRLAPSRSRLRSLGAYLDGSALRAGPGSAVHLRRRATAARRRHRHAGPLGAEGACSQVAPRSLHRRCQSSCATSTASAASSRHACTRDAAATARPSTSTSPHQLKPMGFLFSAPPRRVRVVIVGGGICASSSPSAPFLERAGLILCTSSPSQPASLKQFACRTSSATRST